MRERTQDGEAKTGSSRQPRKRSGKLAKSLLYVFLATVVISLTIVLWKAAHPKFAIHLEKVGDALAEGLKTDPFYDKDAGIIDILKRRPEILEPPDAASASATRESRLKLLYMLTLGEINSIGSPQANPQAKYEMRKSAERYVARGLIELKELHGGSFDATRYEANLRFLSALAWVLDGGMPDGPCLEDLKFCRTHDGDYRKAAAEALAHVPKEDNYTAGLRALGNKDFTAAEKAFTQQLKYFPDDFEALRWRGQCRLQSKAFQQALADFDECLTREPKDAYTLEARGLTLYRMGRAQDAVAAWQSAAEASEERAPILREFIRVAQGGA